MKKQVIFIMTDTQRWDMVNCYKETGLSTPNIDRLASEGVRYERAYTTQPVCGPARAGLFTGCYPSSVGSWSNCMPLGDNVKTIGQRLRDNGIVNTAYIGKWHLDGSDYFGNGICPDGWDEEYWYDMRRYLEELTEDERMKSRLPQTMDYEEIAETFTYGHRCSERAMDYISKHQDDDYFLVVSFDEPHHPFLCPPPFDKMYKDYEYPKTPATMDVLEGKPGYQKVWAGDTVNSNRDAYKIKSSYFFGCNSYVDYEIGKVLETARKHAPDAMIMYTSDHGDFLGGHCLFAKGPAAYDDIARIPFIIKKPDGLAGAVYSKEPVSHISVCPTILEYFNIPVPNIMEGQSILKTTENIDLPAGGYAFIQFGRFEVDHDHYGGFQLMRAVTDGKYKLAIHLLSEDEFYDLNDDPYECKNLINAEETAEIRNHLHDILLAKMNATRDPFRGYYWETRPWRKDAVKPTWRYTEYTRQRENEEYEPRQLDYATGLVMEDAHRYKFSSETFPKFESIDKVLEWMKTI